MTLREIEAHLLENWDIFSKMKIYDVAIKLNISIYLARVAIHNVQTEIIYREYLK